MFKYFKTRMKELSHAFRKRIIIEIKKNHILNPGNRKQRDAAQNSFRFHACFCAHPPTHQNFVAIFVEWGCFGRVLSR